MLEGRRKMLAEEKKAQQALFPHRKKNPEGEGGETFFDRCAAMDKRLQEKRVKAVEDYEKSQRPPPTAKKWGEVQDNFLKRWIDFNKKREENLEKLDQETMPPFRQPGSEPLAWEDVQDHFLGSQAECTARIEARVKASEEAMKSKATKEGGAEFKMKCVFLGGVLQRRGVQEKQEQKRARQCAVFKTLSLTLLTPIPLTPPPTHPQGHTTFPSPCPSLMTGRPPLQTRRSWSTRSAWTGGGGGPRMRAHPSRPSPSPSPSPSSPFSRGRSHSGQRRTRRAREGGRRRRRRWPRSTKWWWGGGGSHQGQGRPGRGEGNIFYREGRIGCAATRFGFELVAMVDFYFRVIVCL